MRQGEAGCGFSWAQPNSFQPLPPGQRGLGPIGTDWENSLFGFQTHSQAVWCPYADTPYTHKHPPSYANCFQSPISLQELFLPQSPSCPSSLKALELVQDPVWLLTVNLNKFHLFVFAITITILILEGSYKHQLWNEFYPLLLHTCCKRLGLLKRAKLAWNCNSSCEYIYLSLFYQEFHE